jgi:hypothetical protein
MLRAAQVAHDRMLLARLNGRPDEALAFAKQAAGWLEKFHVGKSDVSQAAAVLSTYLNVAYAQALRQQFDESLRLCRRGIQIARAFEDQSYVGTFSGLGEVLPPGLDEALGDSVRR